MDLSVTEESWLFSEIIILTGGIDKRNEYDETAECFLVFNRDGLNL